MYCSQCGSKNDENALFCSSCGAPINRITDDTVITETTPVVERIPVQENFTSTPMEPQHTFVTPESFAETPMKKKPILPIVIAVIVILAVVIGGALVFGGGYSQKTPEKAIMSFFKCVDKGDVDSFIKMFPEDTFKDLKDVMKESGEDLDEYLETLLKETNDSYIDEAGKKWFDKLEVTDVDIDGDYASAEVELDGEAVYIDLEKIDGKWYLDFGGAF